MIRLPALLLCIAAAFPAAAQVAPDQGTARSQLFGSRDSSLVVYAHPFLSQSDIATLQAMPQAASLKYYGALAAAPGAGLQSEASTGAFNYHSPPEARRAALAGCDAKRSGGPACVVVAEVVPRDYVPGRDLTLNQDASAAVSGRAWRRAGPDAALAISSATGAWGLGAGRAAALASCAAAGAPDCTLAVAD